MELNTQAIQLLEKLIRRPYLVEQEHTLFLQNVVEKFPYFQVLHLLLAKATMHSAQADEYATKAALYHKGPVLYKILTDAKQLYPIGNCNIITYNFKENNAWINDEKEENIQEEGIKEKLNIPIELMEEVGITEEAHKIYNPSEDIDTPEPIVEVSNVDKTPETRELSEILDEIENIDDIPSEDIETPGPIVEKKSIVEVESLESTKPKIENLPPLTQELEKVFGEVKTDNNTLDLNEKHPSAIFDQPTTADNTEKIFTTTILENFSLPEDLEQSTSEHSPSTTSNSQLIEIENLPPIDSEVAKIYTETIAETSVVEEEILEKEEAISFRIESIKENSPSATNTNIEEQDWVNESIIHTDFFVLDKNFNSETIIEEVIPQKPEEQVIDNRPSKYDDKQLPYSFLWWLSRTRKEHEKNTQPFSSDHKHIEVTKKDNPLQHQIVAHIFQLQANLEEEDLELKDEFEPKPEKHPKETEIIDNFIKNDPQIKAPKPDQVNNENKAKKSAEDQYDLVSETLAQIYIEQMLYSKAIETYQKLSLKFPEKSRYFANLIKSIEKKI